MRRSRRVGWIALVTAVVVGVPVGAQVAGQGVASAATTVHQWEVVTATSPWSSEAKEVTASCPAGKVAAGGGGLIFETRAMVALTKVWPENSPTANGFTVAATETNPAATHNWAVQARAICISPPPGLTTVVSPAEAGGWRSVASAKCPAGLRPIGVGGQIVVQRGSNVLVYLGTHLVGDGGMASGDEAVGTGGNGWRVWATAVCARFTNAADLRIVTGQAEFSELTPKTAPANCPSNMTILGTSAATYSDTGTLAPLTAATPSGNGVWAKAELPQPVWGWGLWASAVCVK